jgi:hypothetical protein
VNGHFGTWAAMVWMSGFALGCGEATHDDGTGGSGGSSGSGGSGGTGAAQQDPVADILRDPAVQSALEEARDQGIDVVTHTEREPPDLTGYYLYELGAGTWVATGNGANVGFKTTALELRVDMKSDGIVDTASVSSFDGLTPFAHGTERGYLVRGAGNEVTLYGRRSFSCELSGSSYVLSQAYLWAGTIDEDDGAWLDQKQFTVTTATEGELTTACADSLVGNTELVGGWAAAAIPIATKVTADDLVLMCVDESRGYVPPETWTDSGGTSCECTPDYAVACEG